MNSLLVLLTQYSSGGEAFFCGAMSCILFYLVSLLVSWVKDKVRNHRENHTNDWHEMNRNNEN